MSRLAIRFTMASVLALAVSPSLARAECTIRRSLFYTSACKNQVCTYAYETIVCDGVVHWHGHLVGCEGSCPQNAE